MASTYSHILPGRVSRTLPRNVVLRAWALYRQRRHLAELDTHLLDDIGLDATAARQESCRPLWDAPEYWRR